MSRLSEIKIIIIAVLLTLLISCAEKKPQLPDEINISVSLPPYADFVKRIVGNRANIYTLIPPGINAHSFEPSPETIKQVVKSNIYFRVGPIFNLENILFNKIGHNSFNMISDCSKGIEIIDNDPHLWLAPNNVKIITKSILDVMVAEYPQHKNYFTNNRNKFITELESVDSLINERLNQKKNRVILVYHPAWKYLSKHYNLEEIAIEQEGKSPRAKDLQNFIVLAKSKGANCIFFDPHFDESAVSTIAVSLGLEVSSLNPLPTNYIENLKEVGEKLERYLK